MGFLVAACRLLVAVCMRDLVPRPGFEPGPPALGAQSLIHWTTREVPSSVFSIHLNFEHKYFKLTSPLENSVIKLHILNPERIRFDKEKDIVHKCSQL